MEQWLAQRAGRLKISQLSFMTHCMKLLIKIVFFSPQDQISFKEHQKY